MHIWAETRKLWNIPPGFSCHCHLLCGAHPCQAPWWDSDILPCSVGSDLFLISLITTFPWFISVCLFYNTCVMCMASLTMRIFYCLVIYLQRWTSREREKCVFVRPGIQHHTPEMVMCLCVTGRTHVNPIKITTFFMNRKSLRQK